MLTLNDVELIENYGSARGETIAYVEGLQRAVNDGTAWKLQGSIGRTLMDAINAGVVLLGRGSSRDYYGNVIPSRWDVEPGTKGSFEYVAERNGEGYAHSLAEL